MLEGNVAENATQVRCTCKCTVWLRTSQLHPFIWQERMVVQKRSERKKKKREIEREIVVFGAHKSSWNKRDN